MGQHGLRPRADSAVVRPRPGTRAGARQATRKLSTAMDQKNLFLAIAMSLAILIGWQFFIEGPRREQQLAEQQRQAELAQQAAPAGQTTTSPGGVPLPSTIGGSGANGDVKPRSEAIASARRIALESPSLTGSEVPNTASQCSRGPVLTGLFYFFIFNRHHSHFNIPNRTGIRIL